MNACYDYKDNQGAFSIDKTLDETTGLKIECKIIDDLNIQNVGYIKIDVEGHELQVLQGMRQHLLNSHPIVVTEALTYNELFKQVQFLQEFGYTMPINLDQRNFVFRIQ